MFEQLEQARARKLPRYALLSIGAHVVLVLFIGVLAFKHSEDVVKPAVEVKFVGPGKGSGPPPPPPPKGTHTPKHKKTPTKTKIEIPTKVEIPKTPPVVEKKEEPKKDEPEGESFGVKGGVAGGVKDGVLNGTVGGTGGGGDAGPPPDNKPRNVLAFAIKKDALNTPPPRMSESYKNFHRGETVSGSYKVCVGEDGHVYDVIPVQSIAGADEAFIEQLKADWLYKPQRSPVCFTWNATVSIQ